jgi:uncharacterized protein
MTGYFRNGLCDTCGDDRGMHTICAQMDAEFLKFSKKQGNDLSTPQPEYQFSGLQAGDFWCLCLQRWIEAFEAGVAPKIKLEASHASILEFIDLDVLQDFAVR